jgi:hypothetical protein
MPMNAGSVALAAAGGYLMIFAWAIRITWIVNDRLATAVMLGTMLAMWVWSCLTLRGRTGDEVRRTLTRHLALGGLVITAIFNLRVDVWVASEYGVTVAEAHKCQPTWIVPLLTLGLAAWTGALFLRARAKTTTATPSLR